MLSRDGWFTMGITSGNRTLSEYYYKGEIFIIGPPGVTFQISLRNRSIRRAFVVLTVDGLCAIDGLELLDAGQGYILESGVLLTVDSWRFNANRSSPFKFGILPSGYDMDHPGNPGVIQASFFFEQTLPYYSANWSAQMGYGRKVEERRGWGTSSKESLVRQQFAKERSPTSTLILQYETEDTLRKNGVISTQKP